MEVIKLNLIPTGALPVAHASQYDDGRIFRADLYDGAEVYHLDGTETISCELKKPDGNIVTLAVTNTSESFIVIQTTEQACAVAGESLAKVKIEKGDDKIGSLNFILSVERSPIEGGISSASEINNLWTQVDGMVADALATQYDSANVVFDNDPTEGHGIPYTVTSEGIGIAIDDALEMTELASGAIATFESDYALPLRDLEIEINAVQESGTPTPSSPKAISGFTGANIHVADDETPHVIDNVTAISWQDEAGTVYGGSLDVTSGVLTVTHKGITLDGTEAWTELNNQKGAYLTLTDSKLANNYGNGICSQYTFSTWSDVSTGTNNNFTIYKASGWTGERLVFNFNGNTFATFKSQLGNTPAIVVYELATPYTIQLTPTQISAIVGTNNVFTDTNGDTSLEYYTKRGEQTVHISEATAKEVINSSTFGTLDTTDKTITGAINEVNTAVSACINSASFTNLYKNENFTSSTTLAYTGVSVNIPAKSYYSLSASALFQNSQPSEVRITSSDSVYNLTPSAANSEGTHPTATLSGYTDTALTLYIWAKYASAMANQILTSGFAITMP